MTRHRIFVGKDVHKFSSAHMTVFPDGSKERIHGHNFQVVVEFELHTTRLASFLDFGVVKKLLVELCAEWDQRLLLAAKCPALEILRKDATEVEFKLCGKRYVMPVEEVALLPLENVVVETLAEEFTFVFVERMGAHLRRDVVASLTVTISESNGQGGAYTWEWNERPAS